jgi:hypothetical protein
VTVPTDSGAYTLRALRKAAWLVRLPVRDDRAMPLGRTFAFATSDTAVQLTLLLDRDVPMDRANGGNWTTPFANGVSNWGEPETPIMSTAHRGVRRRHRQRRYAGDGRGLFDQQSEVWRRRRRPLLAGGNTLTLIGTGESRPDRRSRVDAHHDRR